MRSWDTFELILIGIATGLSLILIISFRSRARVFCQYLRLMTGIHLTPGEVKRVFRLRGQQGVRDLFLDLMIREDLKDASRVTPETPRSQPATALIKK